MKTSGSHVSLTSVYTLLVRRSIASCDITCKCAMGIFTELGSLSMMKGSGMVVGLIHAERLCCGSPITTGFMTGGEGTWRVVSGFALVCAWFCLECQLSCWVSCCCYWWCCRHPIHAFFTLWSGGLVYPMNGWCVCLQFVQRGFNFLQIFIAWLLI